MTYSNLISSAFLCFRMLFLQQINMMNFRRLLVLSLLALGNASMSAEDQIVVRVLAGEKNAVDSRLFGQFMERATWGEPGPESAWVSNPPHLPEEAVKLLQQMNIPVIRFPGGTDVDYIDWCDMIDNVPEREEEGRPVTRGHQGGEITNRFGYNEYFALRDRLKCETILVVNFLDAAAKQLSPRDAAIKNLGLLAYANAPVGAALPWGMIDWPAVRAQNGHPEPFGAEYIQIGNETWLGKFVEKVRAAMPDATPQERAQWYTECLLGYIRVIREIDPEVKIIIDAEAVDQAEEVYLDDPIVRHEVAFVAFHSYAPTNLLQQRADGKVIDYAEMSPQEWWALWTSMPGWYSENGRIERIPAKAADAAAKGYQIACTEWNWNGWNWRNIDPPAGITPYAASGLGTAAFLHGMMRNGNEVRLATQSMLIGTSWDITAVRVDSEGNTPPFYYPQGQVTGFYSRHHGNSRLEVQVSPQRLLSFETSAVGEQKRGALLDAVATKSSGKLYLHLINRSMENPVPVRVDLSELGLANERAILHTLSGANLRGPQKLAASVFDETSREAALQTLKLPPASVSVLEIQLSANPD